ncbi:hypothetical protein, conserved [Plasmodium ovale wallikeri]|uniref:Uncharacterized protein n=1 Tax=Plasmodium ovale wallikeri TaxID=864142 RepID=A0A1A9AJP9_PLAOA|nr:hypothetical protein, conserved [Plasmodium ovale wallikeri]
MFVCPRCYCLHPHVSTVYVPTLVFVLNSVGEKNDNVRTPEGENASAAGVSCFARTLAVVLVASLASLDTYVRIHVYPPYPCFPLVQGKKPKLKENRKILLEIGNSLKQNDVNKSLAYLDELLSRYSNDNKISKNMSMICGNVLNLCSKFNDINSMVNVIKKMKKNKIDMQENSYLAICNYYISNNYIDEYILTINKMIEKKMTIRERFYKYILTNVLDLPLHSDNCGKEYPQGEKHNNHDSTPRAEIESRKGMPFCKKVTYENEGGGIFPIDQREICEDQTNVQTRRCHLIKTMDYSNFKKYTQELGKYNVPLQEEDKKYILNNYLLIDIFRHMNANQIKIKLVYILKLINYVYENVQYVMRKNEREEEEEKEKEKEEKKKEEKEEEEKEEEEKEEEEKKKEEKEEEEKEEEEKEFPTFTKEGLDKNEYGHYHAKDILQNDKQEDREKSMLRNNLRQNLKNIMKEQLRDILELYKINYESMNINIKKYEETIDEEERRNVYYCVNKIVKKIPFIQLTENVKNTFNCKNCDENINTYFLPLKHVIIVIVNIILITHLFNKKEIFKIRHFFSILNGGSGEVEQCGESGKVEERGENSAVEQCGESGKVEERGENSAVEQNSESGTVEQRGESDVKKLFNTGTYTCLLDGANIGYNKQNVENGRFSFLQIEILKEIIKRKNNETPLIILPKIYHYRNSLKHFGQYEEIQDEEKHPTIFIPNKTIKIKKGNPFYIENRFQFRQKNESITSKGGGNDKNGELSPTKAKEKMQMETDTGTTNTNMNKIDEHTTKDGKDQSALSYVKKIFNKLDITDVEIIKKWEKEKCLYICNYNMYDDYYYILGSLARSNNLFNIYHYIEKLSKHYYFYENLNHNMVIDNYNLVNNKLYYVNREILHVYNNVIYDKNSNIMVLVSDSDVNRGNKYISMNEQYYNDKIRKKRNPNMSIFEKYKSKLTFREKEKIPYKDDIFMESYAYDLDGGDHEIVKGQSDAAHREEKLQDPQDQQEPQAQREPQLQSEENSAEDAEAMLCDDGQSKKERKTKEIGKKLHYSNIYIRCVKNAKSTQKPIYIYTNDKMKNHYFNEYTNFILKKWKRKSFISFYFKQPIILFEIKKQTEENKIDINNIINNYKLPYVNLENYKLCLDDIVSYKDKNIYHIKINIPNKTFISYQNENLPFFQQNSNIVKYLCIDFSKM